MSGFTKIAGERRPKKDFSKPFLDPKTNIVKMRKGYDNGNRITVQDLLTEASIHMAVQDKVQSSLTIEQVEVIAQVVGGCVAHMGNTGNHCLDFLNVVRNMLNQPDAFLKTIVGDASAAAVKAGFARLTTLLSPEVQADIARRMKELRATKPTKAVKLQQEHAMMAALFTTTPVPVTQYGFMMSLNPNSSEDEFATLRIEATGAGNKVMMDFTRTAIVASAAEAAPVKINKSWPTLFVPKDFTDVAYSRILRLAALAVASYYTVHEGENVKTSRSFSLGGKNYTYEMSGIRNMYSFAYAAVEKFYSTESYASSSKFTCGSITFGVVLQGTVNFRPYINRLATYAMILRHPNLKKIHGMSSLPDTLAKEALDVLKYLLYEPNETARTEFAEVIRAVGRFSFEYKPKAPSAPLLARKRLALQPAVNPSSMSGDEEESDIIEVQHSGVSLFFKKSADRKAPPSKLVKINSFVCDIDLNQADKINTAIGSALSGSEHKTNRGAIRSWFNMDNQGVWLAGKTGPDWSPFVFK